MYRREPLEKTIINTLGSKAEEINPRGDMGERVKSALISGNQKSRSIPRRPLALYGYVAAVLLLFVSINTVYADNISQALRSLFGMTPVYSTTLEGKAYYLKNPVTLDKNLTIESFMVADGLMEMEFETDLGTKIFKHMKVVAKDGPSAQYFIEGVVEDPKNHYLFFFTNEAKDIKPAPAFDLIISGKTYSVALAEAKNLDTSGISPAEASNKINLVSVGAASTDKNGKQVVQFIATFSDNSLKLTALGDPVDKKVIANYEQKENGMIYCITEDKTHPLYAIDKSGAKYKLTAQTDTKAQPITIFETDASPGRPLTVKVPALLATYEKALGITKVSIPNNGEKTLNQAVDLVAQKAVLKSAKRTSPTSAVLTFQLNTGANKNIAIRSFDISSGGSIKKYNAEFSGNKAVVTMEINRGTEVLELGIARPEFVMNGGWTINLK